MKPEQQSEPVSNTLAGTAAGYGSELDGTASMVVDATGASYEAPTRSHLSRWTSAYRNHSHLLKLTIVVLVVLLLGSVTGLVLVARHIAGSQILGTSGSSLNLQSPQMNVTNNYSLTVNGQLHVAGPATLQSLQVSTNANVQDNLTVGGTVQAGNFVGNGARLTNVDASALNGQPGSYYTNADNIGSGTLSDSRLSPNVTLMGNTFNGPSQLLQLLASGALPALDGSNLSNVNAAALQGYAASYFMDAANLSSGTLSDARLSSNVPLLSANNTFTGGNDFQTVSAASILQNGYQVCDTSGNCGTGGGGVTATGATAGSLAMFTGATTIANSIITQSGTTVTVAGTLAATALQGDGSGVTNVDAATLTGQPGSYYTNASNLNAGTVPTAQISGSYNGITGTGDLTSGSISSGFGVISTTNTIATTGQLQGNTLSAASGAFAVSGTGAITATGLTTSGTVTLSALGAGIVQSDAGGTLSSGSLDRNSALLTGQTSVANGGTGATTAAGARANLAAAASGANSDITSLSAVTSVGSTGAVLTLQGNASTVLSATASGFTTSVGFAAPTANVNYLFDTSVSNGTYTICTTAGNCAGSSGVTASSPGTANTIAMFTGADTIANSLLSQAGTTVSVAGTLAATALQGDGSGLTNLDGTNISSGTVGVSVGGTGVSSFTQYGVIYGNGSGALQVTAAGTTGDCLVASSGAAPTWQSCASAASGASPGGPAGGDLSGTYPNPQVSGLSGTPLSISSLTSGNVLVYNGTDWANVSLSGDLTVDGAGLATIASGAVTGAKIAAGTITGSNIASGTVANGNLVNSQITITSGTGLNGGGAVSLGGSTTLSVLYGSTAGTAVAGNTTLTCAAGSGNLTGGGTTITLGAGGTCGSLDVVSNPTFSGLTLNSLGSGIMQTDSLGNVSSTTIDRNSSLLTGQTSVANGGTGATTAAGARANLAAAASGANSDITSLSAVTSVGSTGAALTLQGNASTVLTASDSGFTTSVGFAAPTANVNYLFATATAGTYTICTTVGNCAGAGAGVTVSSSGTNGTIAMFTGSQTIANSILSQSGTTVTVAGTLAATALQGDGAAITNLNGTNIASGTVGISVGGTGTNVVGTAGSLAYSNGSNYAFTGVGTAGECLVSNASSAPSWTSCSGAAGSLAGDVTGPLNANTLSAIQGATLSVTGLATSNLLIYNGTDWVNASLSGDLSVSGAGVATIANGAVTGAKIASATITGANIAANTVANSNLVSSDITITAGTGLNGGGAVSLGGSTSLNVVYGGTAGTAVEGNTTLICPAAGTNVSGGGNTITLGAGGTCGALSVVGSPTFSGLTLSGFSAGIVQTDGTGAVSSTTIDRNSALLTGQTAVANGGTGATTAAGARTNLGAAASGANSDITSLDAATSVGATTAALTLQGNASTTLTSTSSGFTTTVGFSGTPTGAVIYHFDASATPGTYTICTTIGNCAGAGGGVTTSSTGTNGTIAMFTGSSTIANSILTQSGTTVTVAGTLAATDLQGSGSGITNLNASNVASGMLSPSYGGTGTSGLTQYGVVLGGGTGNALTVTAAGATGDCLVANTGAAPTWMSCSSAGSGGTPGGPAGGDLSGSYPNPEVVGIYNVPLSITSLSSGNFLQYNGTNWVNNSFSGDLTVSNTGVATIANGAVTGAKIANNTITNTNLASGSFTNVTGVGTLTAGTWNATAIGVAYGGTGLTAAPSSGQIMIGNSSGGYTLATITPSTNIAVSSTSGSITIGLTGTVGVVNGGTGATSVGAAGSVAYSNGTNYAFSAAGTSGQCLTSGGTAAPTWTTCAAGSGGSGYIQNQSAAAQSANYYIQSAATSTVTATLEALSGQTADLLQFQTSAGAPVGGVNSAGQLYYTNSGHTITLQSATLSANQAITMPNASGTMITTGNLTDITATGTVTAGTWNGSTIGVPYGGTGVTSLTQYGVLYGNGTGSILATPVGTTGQCLIGNTGAAPSWQSCGSAAGSLAGDVTGALSSNTLSKIQGTNLSIASLTSANFLQYDGTSWVNQSISGDATVSNGGVLTVANGAITGTKIANATITGSNIAANTVANGNLVNSSITVVNGTNVTGGALVSLGGSITLNVINNPTFSGLVTASGGLTATSLTDTGLTTAGIVTNTAGGALGTVASVPVANGGTGLTATPANGQLLIGNGTGYTLGTLSGTGITVTNGSGTIGLSAIYGAVANTAVQGNTTLTCSSTSGNLSGGGDVITLGSGGTCSPITLTATPTFTSATLTGNNALTLGTANSFNGAIVLQNATSANTVTLTTAAQSGSYNLTIPTLTGADTICLKALGNCTAGASSFIQNQNSAQQATSNFWISGTGRADTSFLTPLLDTPTAVALNIGTTNATQINLNQNVVVAASMSLTLTGGTTASRPASPTKGQLYFDTTTNTLLTYNGTKWMSDEKTPNKIVAMGTATGCTGTSPVASSNPDGADFVSTSCTDAETTIAAAISALPASGGTVYLEDGTYIVGNTLTIPSNVTLAGDGTATTLKLMDTGSAFNGILYVPSTSSRVTIRNLVVDGNAANETGTTDNIAIKATGSPSTVVANVVSTNSKGRLLYAYGTANLTVSDSSFTNSTYTQGSVGIWNTTNSTFTGNNVSNNTGYGLTLWSSQDISVVGNTFASNAYGVDVESSSNHNVVSGNTMNGNGVGVFLGSSTYNTVTGNDITGSTASSNGGGIRLYLNASYNTVSNNTVSGGAAAGIYAYGQANNNTIQTNNITGNAQQGIFLDTASSNDMVSGNYLYNNGGSGSYSSIEVHGYSGSDDVSNSIVNNTIIDTAGAGYAIALDNTQTVATYLSGNTFSGTGATSISDSGSNTIWNNQLDGNGNSINKGTNALTVGTSTVNGTLSVQGGITTAQLSAPQTPTIAKVGTAGTSTYTYAVTSLDGTGETLASTAASISNGYSPLSGTNYNTITWGRISGATSYRIYRTAVSGGGSPATTGLIGTVAATGGTVGSVTVFNDGTVMTFNDTGLAASGTTPAVNTTGGATIAGQVQGSSAVFTSANSLTVGKASTATGSVSFANASNANIVTLTTAAQSGSYNLTIPVLTANDTICTINTGCGSPVGVAGGDLSGSYPNPTVSGLSGKALSITSLAANQTLVYNGTNWVNSLLGNSNLTAAAYSNILGTGALASGSIASGFGTISTTNTITTTAAIQGGTLTAATGAVTSGNATTAGSLVVNDGSGHTVTIATAGALTTNQTLTLPNASGTICLQTATTCGFESTTGTDFIQNQTASAQTANFNISGNGTVGGSVYTGTVDTAAAGGTLSLGATNATTVHIGTNAASATTITQGSSNAGTTVKLQGGSTYLYVTNNGIGVDTTTPASTLDLGAGASSSLYNGVRTYNNVYSGYTASASQTGTLEIVMPNAWTNTMLRFDITGYDFSGTTGAWRVTASGYNYSSTSSWYDVSASTEGSAPFTEVRFAYDTALGKAVLLLGNTSTVWHYPQFTIAQVEAGLSNVGLWGSGYSSAFLASEANIGTITSPTTTAVAYTNQTFLQGGNSFGAAAVLGTNDANSLLFRTNGTTRLALDTSGNATLTGALTVQGTTTSTFAGALQAVSFDANTAAALNVGATNATSINIGKTTSNIATTIYGTTLVKPTTGNDSVTAFQVQNASTASVLNVDTTTNTVTVGVAGTGGVFLNNGATANAVYALSNFTTNGAMTTSAIINAHTSFTIPQTTASITLTLPAVTTNTSATHTVYVANTGSAALTIAGVTLGAGTNASFLWNGSSWSSTAVSTGVTLVGALDGGTANAKAATISGNTIYLQSASATNAGVVNTLSQTFTGDKTFKSSSDSPTALQVKDSGGTAILTVDTADSIVGIQSMNSNQSALIVTSANTNGQAHIIDIQNSSGTDLAGISADANQNITFGLGSGNIGTTTGGQNISLGSYSLYSNTTGGANLAFGGNALSANTAGGDNIAIGHEALADATTANYNIGIGSSALLSAVTGDQNVAMGYYSLGSDTTGQANVAIGQYGGYMNTTGNYNTFLGAQTGNCFWTGQFCTSPSIQNSTAIGANTQVQASDSIVLGSVENPVHVGIGTTVPLNTFSVSPLDVDSSVSSITATQASGSATITASAAIFSASSVGEQLIWSDGTTEMVTGYTDSTHITGSDTSISEATQYFRLHHIGLQVTSAGTVGLGTTNPGYQLDVSSYSSIQGRFIAQGSNSGGIVIDNAAGGNQSLISFQDAGTTKFQLGKDTNNRFSIYDSAHSRNVLQTTTSGNLLLLPTGGYVGMGISSTPNYQLDVAGDINTSTQYRIGGTVICTSLGCTPAAGSSNYIQNQTATSQVAGFKINGTGTAAALQAASLDTSAAGTLSLGTSSANAISLGSAGITTTTAGSFDIKQNLTLDGTYTTSNNTRMYYSGTLNSSSTTYQYGIQNSAAFTPTGASLLGIYGMSNQPNISGSALNINNVIGTISGVTTSAGYTGTIANGVALQAQDAIISGSNKFGSYSEFLGSVIASNGGNTSGTISNYGMHLLGMTTGAGTGGTLNNYAINLTMPTGTGGTTNNYGLYIQGNGNGASGANYSLYNGSTAVSYFAGGIQAASTVNINGSPTVGALNVTGSSSQSGTGTITGTSGGQTVTGTGTAFTSQLALGDTITVGGATYAINSITSSTSLTIAGTIGSSFSAASFTYTPPAANLVAAALGNGLAINAASGTDAITSYNGAGLQAFYVTSGGYLYAAAGANISQSVNMALYGSGYTVTMGNANNNTVVGGALTVAGLATATTGLVVGSGANTITLSPTSGYTATGTARHQKTITLTPEYAGAVLDSASDATCSASYSGTMTSAYDSGARSNSYLWTSSNASSQCYDVVVQVPIPSDFNGWASAPQIMAKGSSAANTSYGISIQDGSGSYETGYGSGYATGSPSTSWANIASSSLTGNYSPNGVMTIRIRMGAQNSANMYLGNIVLTYYSSF